MSEPIVHEPPTTMLIAAVEAVLFAAAEPVHPREIASAFEDASEDDVVAAIESLRERYASGPGGLTVEQVAGAYRLATKPEVGGLVRQFFRQRNRTRLSPAGLETLAIIAYRQPMTVPEIQAIRGVDPTGSLKSLLEKKMVRILGRKKVVGNPLLYGTTKQFLVHFGLNRLEDLPSIEEFDQFLGALDGGQAALFGGATPRSADDAEPSEHASVDGSEEE
jgi:segregation and condensation protein B